MRVRCLWTWENVGMCNLYKKQLMEFALEALDSIKKQMFDVEVPQWKTQNLVPFKSNAA